MADESNDNSKTLLDAGMRLGEIQFVDAVPFLALPGLNGDTKVVNLEHMLDVPARTKATIKAHSLNGFLAYWNRNINPAGASSATSEPEIDQNASVYADLIHHRFTGIFDDHRAGARAWGQHRITYECPKSPEYSTWFGKNGIRMEQVAFARFIEENLVDVINPASADILAVSRELVAKKSVDFKQGTTLANGAVTLSYQEDVEGSVGNGQMRVPEVFTIAIPVFLGGPAYKIDCRLRYTIPNGQSKGLTMWFDIDRPHKIIEAAFGELVAALETGIKGKVIEADPVAAR